MELKSPRDQQELQERIGYFFKDSDSERLRNALTTRAYANEHNITPEKTMESFQTLGDALIDVIVLQNLINKKKCYTPEDLTDSLSEVVRNAALPPLAEAINLIEFVRWGNGQIKEEHWKTDDLVSDCLESLIGAVYLDSGQNMEVTAGVYDRIEKLAR
ncbi:MAG: ribonuclease III domain-containing protein [Methanogenium sp.]|jgi:ribonuclease-3